MEITKNNIVVTYSGTIGSSTAVVSAEANEGIDRSEQFEMQTMVGDVTKTLMVTQVGRRETFSSVDGVLIPIYVLKENVV